MNRRWIATGIAVALSLPLIPVLSTWTERLTGTDRPVIVMEPGWKLERNQRDSGGLSIAISRVGGNRIYLLDRSGSMADMGIPRHPFAIDPRSYLQSVVDRYQGDFFTYQDADSGFNHGIPSGMFGGYFTGWAGHPGWDLSATVVEGKALPASDRIFIVVHARSSGEWRIGESGPGIAYPAALAASGGTPPYSNWTISAGALPDGLVLDVPNGVIHGQATTGSLASSLTVSDKDAGDHGAKALTSKAVARGWYAVGLTEPIQRGNRRVDLTYVGGNGRRKELTITASESNSGSGVAWIYFNGPGTLTITAGGAEGQPAIRAVGYSELLGRCREITFAKAELTVFLFCEVLPVAVWILTVCCLRALAYWAIRKLPRSVRRSAEHEIHVLLSAAKWAGVGCYLIWTVKDVLAGLGIVFVA